MIKNSGDARAQRTKALLKTTMIEQLQCKRLHEITVSSLCRLCGINRVTFYDHYKDVFDLEEAIENDIICELKDTFRKLSLEDANSYSVSDAMFEFLDAHRTIMLLLLKGENGNSFHSQFYEALFPFFEEQLNYRYGLSDDLKREDMLSIMHYVASGYNYFYTKYLEDPDFDYHAISALCTELSTQAFLAHRKRS